MKKLYILLITLLITSVSLGQEAVITGYVDSPCSGGDGRTVEIYVDGTINFAGWNLVRQLSGGGFSTNIDISILGELTDTFAYITNDQAILTNEFGITTNMVSSSSINANGDDAFQITDNTSTIIDRFGEDGVDGTDTPWEHVDTYYYRVDGVSANAGVFVVEDFTYGDQNLLDGEGLCNMSNALSTFVPFGTYSTTASTTPTISVSDAVSGLDYFEGSGPSASGSFTVSGINLTEDILVSAPSAEFELSLDDATFTPTVTVSQTGGTATTTTVYARLASGLTSSAYSGDATASSAGATGQTVTLSGTVSPPDPQITVSGFLSNLEYFEGSGPSNEDSFTVSGLNLTSDIVVTAPTNFEVSLITGTGFSTSVNIPFGSGTVATTNIFVRLASGYPAGPFSGNITAMSTGATTESIAVSGTVFIAPVCPNVGDIIISEIMRDPVAVDDNLGQYFEVYNSSQSQIDMQSWIINDDVTTAETHTITASVVVPAGGYVVFAINSDSGVNGGITGAYSYDGDISLSNGTDGIIIECSGTVIDQVIWDGTFPASAGASMEFSSTFLARLNNTDNDNGANWGLATTAYGSGDLGSPGTANDFTLSNVDFEAVNYAVYPNPVTNNKVFITSTLNEPKQIDIYDLLGKKVMSEMIIGKELNVSELISGVYILKIKENEFSATRKLVIK